LDGWREADGRSSLGIWIVLDESVIRARANGSDARELIALSALNDTIEHQNIAIGLRFEYENILIKGLLDM
jgi:hypothetical protein